MKYAAAALILLLALFFLCRNSLLQFAFQRACRSVNQKYQLQLTAATLKFSGLDNVLIQQLTIYPAQGDTLLKAKQIELNLSVLDLLTGKIGFDEVKIDTALVSIYNQPHRSNVSFFKKQPADTAVKAKNAEAVSFKKTAEGLKSKLVRVFNTAFYANDIRITYHDSLQTENILVPGASYNLNQFTAAVINLNNNDTLQLTGAVTEKNKTYRFSVKHSGSTMPYLPFLNKDAGPRCRFSALSGTLHFENEGNALHVNTTVDAENFSVGHWRLATEDVEVRHAGFFGKLIVTDDAVVLDSSSAMELNHLKTNLFIAYNRQPQPLFQLQLHMPETVSDTFFHSLPNGIFNTLKGISCSGSLQYDLDFWLPTTMPDSLQFTSQLKRKNFSIRHYGKENYTRVNGPFVYEVFDKDRFVRFINVSSDNPAFTPLPRISNYLVKSVLQSEDPSFMQHRGFLTEAFRESIIKNYKEKRFARGGSTISMQLVKNVFLSRDKTVSRKAEEALIVYLIENLGLVSKERMLEVYLNVIEWGPNVYGITEAARFYFNKTPAELNLKESIFLAGIIPAPKWFKYQFDKEGKMKNYLSGYFKILSSRMVYKGLINSSDTIGLAPDVKLTGPALRFVLPVDTNAETPVSGFQEE